MNCEADVAAPKLGIYISTTHDIRNDAYPPIAKTATSFVPYVSKVAFGAKFVERRRRSAAARWGRVGASRAS